MCSDGTYGVGPLNTAMQTADVLTLRIVFEPRRMAVIWMQPRNE
jgi:hypothetical protein